MTLRECGFNLNFAPSVDLHNPNSPAIGAKERAFHATALKTFQHAYAYAGAMKKNDIIPTIKHFPGHGDTINTSNSPFPVINKTYNQIKNEIREELSKYFYHETECKPMIIAVVQEV